jgi:WD40 repeat protein
MQFAKLKEITGHSAGIYSVVNSGEMLYSASADKYVARWNMLEGIQDKFSIHFDSPVYAIAIDETENILIAGLANGDLHVFSLDARKELRFFKQHRFALFSIVINRTKGQFYSADANGNVAVWRLHDQHLLLFLPFDCGKIRRMTLNPNEDLLALCCADGFVRVIDTDFFNERYRFEAHHDGVSSAVFIDEGSCLITGGKDAFLRKWDLTNGTLLKSVPAHNYVIYDLLLLNQGNTIVSASRDKTIKLWDKQLSFLGRLDQKVGGHRHSVNVLCKIDEGSFVSASDDKRMIIWNAE